MINRKAEPPTRRQMEILNCIRTHLSTKGYAPSIREIGEEVGLSSSSTVHSHLRSLEVKGYLDRLHSKPRSIHLANPPLMPPSEEVRQVLQGWLDGRGDVAATQEILARGQSQSQQEAA